MATSQGSPNFRPRMASRQPGVPAILYAAQSGDDIGAAAGSGDAEEVIARSRAGEVHDEGILCALSQLSPIKHRS